MNFGYRRGETPGKHCVDCKDRYPGCHDKCEKYQQALKEWIEYKKEIDSKRNAETQFRLYHGERVRITIEKTKHARPKIK